MNILTLLKDSIRKSDFFKTSQLLRYRAQSQYKSLFGGTISILLASILAITFYQRLLSCVQKNSINSTQQILINGVPPAYKIQTYPRGNFMLAVNIRNINLTTINKYFSVSMDQIISYWNYQENQWNQTILKVPLQQCSQKHWALLQMTEQVYNSWDLDNMFCLPMNSVFQVQGDQLSDTSKKFKILVSPCDSTIPGNNCANKTQVDAFFDEKKRIQARIYILNSNVNPSMKEYIHYNFNYRNMLSFTAQEGSQGNIFVQDYEVQTDQSILPISMVKTEIGATLTTNIIPATHFRSNQNSPYCRFNIFKSDLSKRYIRSFDKFDQLLAYIGGLFGMLSLTLVIVSSYNNSAYQISLGASLFKPEEDTEMRSFGKYNFLKYSLQLLYDFLNLLGISPQWTQTIQYIKCKKQIEKQLDIKYILDRLNYLQTATSTLLEDYQMKSLHLKGKLTLKEAKSRRQAFRLKKDIRQVQKNIECKNSTSNVSLHSRSPSTAQNLNEQKITDTKPPNPFQFFINNNILLKTLSTQGQQLKNQPIDQRPQEFSDSSDEDQASSKNSLEKNKEVANVLSKLRRDTENGDKLSKKIWQLTNSGFMNSLPGMILKVSELSSDQKCERKKVCSIKSKKKFQDIIMQINDEVSEFEETHAYSISNQGDFSNNIMIDSRFPQSH